jgi:rod shape-determining protein MreC
VYRRQVRRRRATLVLLVVACLVLISSHFSEGTDGPLHSAQAGVGSVLAPLEEGASRALKPIRDAVNWVDETFDARGENERLRAEVQDLRSELTLTTEKLQRGRENARVANLAEGSPFADYTPVEARVIGRSASTWNQTLAIDKGESAGLAVDDAVITGDGLIGRVSSLTGGSARVTLLTDQESSVTAKVVDGPQGVVGAEVGDPESLVFELITGNQEVKPGAELVTSGFAEGALRSRFPPGIPIGEAKEATTGEQQLSQRVHVQPFADLQNLEFVTVLTGGPA